MCNKILFSPVGSSDPVRDFYDGPMLHIVRFKKPEKVILFFTKEMEQRDRKDNRYEKAIKRLNKKIQVVKIYSGIEKAHDFNEFKKPIEEHLTSVAKNNLESKIYVNVSSGTPQLITTMNLFITSSQYKFIPIQVATPSKGPNDSEVVKRTFDLSQLEDNFDNISEYSENRLIYNDLFIYRRKLLISQIKNLIANYNYKGIEDLLLDNPISFSREFNSLIRHARCRIYLDLEEANKKLTSKKYMDYRINDIWKYELIEYFNVLKTKLELGHYADAVIMFEPMTVYMQKEFLEKVLNKPINKMINKKNMFDNIYLKNNFPELYKKIDTSRSSYIDIYNMNVVIKHFMSSLDIDNKIEFLSLFETLEKIKRKVRNDIAHSLLRINGKDFRKIINMSEEHLIELITNLIKKIYGKDIKSKDLNIYSIINKSIIKEMEN